MKGVLLLPGIASVLPHPEAI